MNKEIGMYEYVINDSFGGFNLSNEACEYLMDKKGWPLFYYDSDIEEIENEFKESKLDNPYKIVKFSNKSVCGDNYTQMADTDENLYFRNHPDVIEVVRKLKKKANGNYAKLKIVKCPHSPDSDLIEIAEYDGLETLQTIPATF